MYEIVKTSRQLKAFKNTWEYFCKKHRWINDPYSENGVRYNLIINKNNYLFKKKTVIGTIEFIPYDPNNPNSTVEGKFNFSKFNDILLYQKRTWEIDKLCIHENYQGKGYFQQFLHVFLDHFKQYQPKYYLALIEEKLFIKLKNYYGVDVIKMGEGFIGHDTKLIPMLFDIEQLMIAEKKELAEIQ